MKGVQAHKRFPYDLGGKSKTKLTKEEIQFLLKKHRNILKKYKVKGLGLFGSYARRENKKSSDIDFLVEFYKPTFDNYMDLLFFLEDLFGKKVDLITPKGLTPYIAPYIQKEVEWIETG